MSNITYSSTFLIRVIPQTNSLNYFLHEEMKYTFFLEKIEVTHLLTAEQKDYAVKEFLKDYMLKC